jgi:hypothetical protein
MPPSLLLAALLVQGQPPVPYDTSARGPAGTESLRHANGRVAPVARITRVGTPAAPKIDGALDDPVWATAPVITEFLQNFPDDGKPSSERTEVRLLYDDQAIYVGARFFDTHPREVRVQLGRRDSETQSDWFNIGFDSFHDHQTAYQFQVNAAGVKGDWISTGDQDNGDTSWDAVWEAAARRDSLGWTAEMRIPFSQLRYGRAPEQVWGIHLRRYIQRKVEGSEFGWAGRTDQGFTSYFGHLLGLANLPQPHRVELLPFAVGRERRIPPVSGSDPFNDGSRELLSAGLDAKYGVTSNLTLDLTAHPDFGQVELDPALVNLTAFESYFPERRPFFTSGASAFEFRGGTIDKGDGAGPSGPGFFYSRRIGKPPSLDPEPRTGASVDVPERTTIHAAAKLTGRTAGGWTIGMLDAVTAREFARVAVGDQRFRDQVEPLTNFLVARIRRDGSQGRNSLGMIVTSVTRDLNEPRLLGLRSSALAGGADFLHRFGHNKYSLSGSAGWSLIRGDTLAIQAAQRSSARYYQRPDQGYAVYRGDRAELAGWMATARAAKEAGNFIYSATASAISPGFEVNDAGFQTDADRIGMALGATRRWTRPGRVFRSASIGSNGYADFNFGGLRTNTNVGLNLAGTLLNYWQLTSFLQAGPPGVEDRKTRGGPAGYNPAFWYVSGSLSTDYRKPIQVNFGADYYRTDLGSGATDAWSGLTLRPTSALSFSTGPRYSRTRYELMYVATFDDPTAAATYGKRYVMSGLLQRSLDLTTRMDLTFTPNLSFQLFAQPFIAAAAYSRYKELLRPRRPDFIVYGVTPGSTSTPVTPTTTGAAQAFDLDPDGAGPRPSVRVTDPSFGLRSLRGNAVIRWEYRPGSTLFLVWTRSCSGSELVPRFETFSSLGDLCGGTPASNVFAVKLNYWVSR